MILIRHGQSEFNAVYSKTRVDPGIEDPQLTDEGRRQAETAAGTLGRNSIRRVIASPYTRTLQTAEIIAGRLGLPVTVNPVVRERAYFTCDIGSPRSSLLPQWPHFTFEHFEERWWTDPEESVAALQVRCDSFQASMADVEDWPHVLVVSHYAFIEGLTGETIGNGAMINFDPTAPREG